MFLLVAGLMAAGLAGAAIIAFWDSIKEWLNNVAANAVEQVFGYNARRFMHQAISKVDRIVNVIRNRSTVFVKPSMDANYLEKITLSSETPAFQISPEVLEEIKKQGTLVQSFEYKND